MLERLDTALRKAVMAFCVVLLLMTVGFIVYVVVMRYVFHDPPFWGDTLALFANVWLVLLALALAVRGRALIATKVLYAYAPVRLARGLEMVWHLMTIAVGMVLLVHGYEAAMRVPGTYVEFDYLPKTYPLLILPISGALVILAGLRVLIEDIRLLRSGRPLSWEELGIDN